MTRRLLLTASILSLDPSKMRGSVAAIASKLDAVQLDIMDGIFVSNTTYGPEIAQKLHTDLPLDVHLMVANPADSIAAFLAVPVQQITFHAEAVVSTDERKKLIAAIRKGGATAGIALNPDTPLKAVDDVVNDVDVVLLMTVVPGKGGQEFIGSTINKIKALRQTHSGLMIQVDGGINEDTALRCIAAGADNLVIGSALFGDKHPAQLLDRIRHAAA